MHSEEFGLIAGQQLLQCEDLHYGYWEKTLPVTIANLPVAQQRHTEVLFDCIDQHLPDLEEPMIDIGCGIGVTTKKLLAKGLRVDALVPSEWMAEHVKQKAQPYIKKGQNGHNDRGQVYQCGLQDFPIQSLAEPYSLAFFSESYQYINVAEGLSILSKIVKPQGKVIIFDFFRKDDISGKSPLGGGHSMQEFYSEVEKSAFNIVSDQDLTTFMSPNMELVSGVLHQRIIPFAQTLNKFLSTRYPLVWKFIKFLLRKQLREFEFKYSADRNAENFEKYKSYRLIVLSKTR